MTHESCALNITPAVLKKYFAHEYRCGARKLLCLCAESSLTRTSFVSLLTTKTLHCGAAVPVHLDFKN